MILSDNHIQPPQNAAFRVRLDLRESIKKSVCGLICGNLSKNKYLSAFTELDLSFSLDILA